MNKNIKVFGARILDRLGIISRCSPRHSVVVLMFHRVNRAPDCLGLTVLPELFSLQLRYLKDHFRIVSVKDAVQMISEKSVNERCCAVTFDDGYRDNFEIASPLLKEHVVPATFFITYEAIETGQFGWGAFDRTILSYPGPKLDLSAWGVGEYLLGNQGQREQAVITLHRLLKKQADSVKKDVIAHVVSAYGDNEVPERVMMNWDEVRRLAKDDLFTIGAHTVTHPILSRISHDQAMVEIMECKQLLQDKVEQSIDLFAYPNGGKEDVNDEVVSIVKKSGYKAAFTTIPGLNSSSSELFSLKRIDVTMDIAADCKGKFSPHIFKFYISGIVNR